MLEKSFNYGTLMYYLIQEINGSRFGSHGDTFEELEITGEIIDLFKSETLRARDFKHSISEKCDIKVNQQKREYKEIFFESIEK